MLFLCSLIFLAILFFSSSNAAGAETTAAEVKIEAEGNVNYDLENNSITASQNVVLTKGDIILECQELFYDGKTGEVKASGSVKLTTDKFVYESENINFNLNEEIGDLAAFKGRFKKDRDYLLSGESATFAKETGTIFDATMTRCPKPQPDYLFTAAEIKYDSQQVRLRKVKLVLKGVPVFYFPSLSFKTNGETLPDISLDYNGEDGLKLKYDYITPAINNRSWRYQGEVATKGDSAIGLGIVMYGNHISNNAALFYDLDGFWRVEDWFNYNTRLFDFNLDGAREFSDAEKTELGIGLTHKYRQTSMGSWRLGVLARDVFAYDSARQEYGGTYWGYRLDYNPSKYVTLSYLRLNSITGEEDYRDFLEDYKLGANYLYNINIPLSNQYSLSLDGTYNTDQPESWVRRFYRIKYESCCFRFSAGWNDLARSWELNWRIKF